MHLTQSASKRTSTDFLAPLRVLEAMYTTRFVDEKMSKMVRQNKGGSFHLSSLGHELIGTMSGLSLTPGVDWGLPYYRDRAFAIGLGISLVDLFAAFMARKSANHSGGRMMPEHFSQLELNLPCQSSCVGSQFLQAVGVAKGLQLVEKEGIVYVSGGDGSTSQGDFHEALNFACLHKLPLIFVIQDNGWAISVPLHEQTAGGDIATMARGYAGLSVFDIDGCDFPSVSRALKEATDRGRKGEGPSIIIAKVPRIGAHSSSDDPKKYKSEKVLAEDLARDPLPRLENWLQEMGIASEVQLEELRRRCFDAVEKAADEAEQVPFPDVEAPRNVFKESKQLSVEEKEPLHFENAVVMVDALNHGLDEAMAKDEKVVVFGQDVAHGKGGVFGVTRTLTAKYGKRCFNSPLAESTIIALALGMSLVDGLKPVAEIQFADYMWTGVNQLFNELASFYFRSDGQWNCPVVIRMPVGGYIQGGPYHSQSVEAFLAHCPGLKIVIPSNSADAKRLLKAAIADPNPVIFLEHKALYRQRVFAARTEPGADEILPLGKANIVREGSDLTCVVYGMMVMMALEAADGLKQEGISVEIIDLRKIVPLDFAAIAKSLKKTGKLLIIHEAAGNCGFGAEIAARAAEECFSYLDAPIVRVTGEDCPVPYSKELEEAVLPHPKEIQEAMQRLASF